MPTVTRDCNKGLTGISVHQFTEYKHSETHKLSRAVYVYETRAVAFLMRSQTPLTGLLSGVLYRTAYVQACAHAVAA